jgi:hypothetical protein
MIVRILPIAIAALAAAALGVPPAVASPNPGKKRWADEVKEAIGAGKKPDAKPQGAAGAPGPGPNGANAPRAKGNDGNAGGGGKGNGG